MAEVFLDAPQFYKGELKQIVFAITTGDIFQRDAIYHESCVLFDLITCSYANQAIV